MNFSSPGSFREHSADDLTPQELLKHLNIIFSEVLFSNSRITVKDEKRREIISLIRDLCCIMMGEFPKPGLTAWNMLQDRVKIIQVAFRIVDRALVCVEDLFAGNEQLERVLLTQFINLHCILEIWIADGEDNISGTVTPEQLKAELDQISANVLAFIVGETRAQPSWNTLDCCIQACLNLASELVNKPGGFTQPFHAIMFRNTSDSDGITSITAQKHIINVENAVVFDQLLLQSLSLAVRAIHIPKIHITTNTSCRQAMSLLQTYFSLLLGNPYCISTKRRVSSFAKLLVIIEDTLKRPLHDLSAISYTLSQLSLKRLRDGPDKTWYEVDCRLLRLLELYPSGLPLGMGIVQLEAFLDEQTCSNESEALCGIVSRCIVKYIHCVGIKRILHLQEQVSKHVCPGANVLQVALSVRLRALRGPPTSLGKRKRDEMPWRDAVWSTFIEELPLLSLPQKPESDLSGRQWTAVLIKFLDDRFDRILINQDLQAVTQFLDLLVKLTCWSAHCDGLGCSKSFLSDNEMFVQSLTRYCHNYVSLLTGKYTSQIWCQIFALLTKSIAHTSDFDVDGINALLFIISTALKQPERAVRLSAGRFLANMIKFCQESNLDHLLQLEPFMEQFFQSNLENTPLNVVERMPNRVIKGDLQGRILELIVKYLGHKNLIIKGVAYNQLLDLTMENKTPYALMSPYIGRISIAVVSDVSDNPGYLAQLCSFLDMTAEKFFNLTLNEFLPHLVCSRNEHALKKVAHELKKSPVSLVTTHEVLSHVFLLETNEDTDRVLGFILDLLMRSRKNATEPITVLMVVKSTIVPLLGELVIYMGEFNTTQMNKAFQAVIKIAKILGVQNHTQPASLLGEYLMGVVTHLNEVLQDVHGKKTVEMKRRVMRGLGALIKCIGCQISTVASQIMATLQSMLWKTGLAEDTLCSWDTFIKTLTPKDVVQFIGPTSAAFVTAWPTLDVVSKGVIKQTFRYLLFETPEFINAYSKEFVSLDEIPELNDCAARVRNRKSSNDFFDDYLDSLLRRVTNDNCTVAGLSLLELQRFMGDHQDYFLKCALGDNFDPIINKIIMVLWDVIYRDGENLELLQSRALNCLGRLGAVDPDRLELSYKDSSFILYRNFADEEESNQFALYLITDVLLGSYRSTSDIRYQSHLAFAIQELLKFCGFTEALISSNAQGTIPRKIRRRWSDLPQPVLEACAPLLGAKYTRNVNISRAYPYPIYPSKITYREWLQDWTASLINRVTIPSAKSIFDVFRAVVIDKDVGIARCLLPHLVLHLLICGSEEDSSSIEAEISAVLRDQVRVDINSPTEHRLLCAQTVFMLMDHLNKWIRAVRQDLAQKRSDNKRTRVLDSIQETENDLVKVDSVFSNIDHELVAKAAFECKAFARSLMNFERQIQFRQERGVALEDKELQSHYERLHEIYSHLDEPDGMEGATVRVLAPSLEHQIRQHQSTGRWTSAQSCWELQLRQTPEDIESHLGFLQCLRNLGHYDSLQTHIKGVLSRYPDWHELLSGFQVESAWMVGDWQSVRDLCSRAKTVGPPEIVLARILMAMRDGGADDVSNALEVARTQLAAPIHAAGQSSYRRMYQTILNLHLVRDMEIIYNEIINPSAPSVADKPRLVYETLSRRLDSTLPSFRIRELVLSLHRITLGLSKTHISEIKRLTGQAWLSTAKLARKAGHGQTAYSAVLQAERISTPFAFLQSCKLTKANGEPIRALQELNNAILRTNLARKEIIDPTEESDFESKKLEAKAQILRAQWMLDTERFEMDDIHRGFKEAVNRADSWESANFHLGKFYDTQSARLVGKDLSASWECNYQTVKCYTKTLQIGSKYVYQTISRMLTLWLDLGEKPANFSADDNQGMNADAVLSKTNLKLTYAIKHIATYKWLSAFPQIVSRIDHPNKSVFDVLSHLIVRIIEEYPRQALWLFMFVVHSKKSDRNRRAESIFSRIQSNPSVPTFVSRIVKQCRLMTEELLKLCNYQILDEPRVPLSLTKMFPGLSKLVPSDLIVPLQESIIAILPSESSLESSHKPFPDHLPTIQGFEDGIDVMKSLAKPRKITFQADNGKTFPFLGKPKDDLRKDARLMDFNAMINRMLKTDSHARRRQLRIRTYTVITLNEEAGLIQWVPNTIPMRPVLNRSYELRSISLWGNKVNQAYHKIKELRTEELSEFFVREILSIYPPVFHEWFLDTFPEPTAWLASRLSFARTAAVMSMVGFILGLGDRHSENILLDVNSGDIIHVDFDCLFERGKKLETPERVPFRLTHNMQDGLGVTNVDGPFRIACEITMQLLRRNRDCLMSVLDAFIHDPLVEWENEKRRLDKQKAASKRKFSANLLQDSVDLRKLAQNALLPIKRKLQGIYTPEEAVDEWRAGKEMTTSNLVDALIQEAKNNKNLARMYPGWGPFL